MGIGALFVLSLALQQSALTEPVEISATTARVPVVLDLLAKSTGETYLCSSELKDRVVYIEVHGLPITTVKEGIAKALDAKWEAVGSQVVLKQDTDALSVRRKTFTDRTLERIKATIDDIRKAFPKEFDTAAALELKKRFETKGDVNDYSDFMAREMLSYGTPVGRLLFDLLGTLDLTNAATLDGQKFALFSNKAGRFFSLVSFPARRLKQYDAEQAVWDQQFDTSRTEGRLSSSNFAAERSGTQLPVDKVMIAFGRYSSLPNFFVSMALFDQFGTVKGIARFNVYMNGYDRAVATPDRGAQPGDSVVELSDRAKKYLGSFAFEPNDARLPPGDPMYAQIIDPLENEPLAFWIGDLARSFGTKTGGNVFASLDDNLYYDLNEVCSAGKVSAAALEALFVNRSQYEFLRDGSYTVVRQTDPDRAARNTTPRTYLAEFSKELDANGFLSFESLVKFAKVDLSANSAAPALFYHARAIVPGYERVLQFLDKSTLKVLSALSPQERSQLLSGQTLAVGMLSSTSTRALNALIASEEVWHNGDSPSRSFVPGELRVPLWFPDGALPDLLLTLKTNGQTGMAVWNAPYDQFAAWYSFGRSRDTAGAIARFQRQEVQHKFWYGPALDLSLSAMLGQSQIGYSQFFAPLFDLRKAPSKLDDLPEDVRKSIGGG